MTSSIIATGQGQAKGTIPGKDLFRTYVTPISLQGNLTEITVQND